MARFHRVPAVSRNVEDAERRELLGMDNLPIETDISYVYIDLERVESFAESEDNTTEIIMYSGLHSTLNLTIDEFLNIMDGKV